MLKKRECLVSLNFFSHDFSGEKKKEYDDSVDEVKSLDLETSDSEQSVNMDNMRTALPQVK